MIVKILEQSLVIILIVGRWILPRGYVSREKLSDMLLAYVGMSADMLDFLREGIENEQVQCEDGVLSIVILLVFSLSLFQFPIGLNLFIDKKNAEERKEEIGTIFATMLMQDGPFLIVRLYLLANRNRYNMGDSTDRIFFAIKNILVLLLQMYRLFILWKGKRDEGISNSRKRRASSTVQQDQNEQLHTNFSDAEMHTTLETES